MKVYIDDMLVKSTQEDDHFQDLSTTFEILRRYNMKLNPEKCAFGVASGKFLGFLVSNRGIEVNPAQIKAIEEIPDILTIKKEVQNLTALDQDKHEVSFNNLTWDWRNEIVNFLQYGIVPEGKKESQVLQRKAARYCLIRDNLYRKMFGGPLAMCFGPNQTEYVMREVHEGHCENHAGGRSLVKTLIRAGYYWPKMEEDAKSFVAKYDKWQGYANNMHRPAELLHTFGVPKETVCDNGRQFISSKITEFFQSRQIKRITSSPYHPVANGQAESTNNIIINNLKKRLEKSKGNWPEEFSGVLWAYRTITKIATRETPFSLMYGSKALIPVEIGEPSTRFTLTTKESNDEELRINLDLLEQRREAALIRIAAQNQIIERYYNRKAHLRYFKIGDFVLKMVFQSTKTTGVEKLNPNWEGPYKVRGITGKGAYELETMDGKVLPSSWNAVHLKKYYF
nr:uncharacterized protein LOC117280807 [Nicotiana tomentosiformis]